MGAVVKADFEPGNGGSVMTDGVLTLVPDKLYALTNTYEPDGRVSTHQLQARGFASLNAYVELEPEHAPVIDTGLSVHQTEIIDPRASIVGPALPLSIWPTRIGEHNSVCNVRPIVEHFNVTTLYAAMPEPTRWVDFRPSVGSPDGVDGSADLAEVPCELTTPGRVATVGASGRRQLQVLPAPMRLLPTNWIFDAVTARSSPLIRLPTHGATPPKGHGRSSARTTTQPTREACGITTPMPLLVAARR